MPLKKAVVDAGALNVNATLPFNLRIDDFRMAMQDVYDFFFDVNTLMRDKSLMRLDDQLRPAIMSGMLSDMLTSSLAKHSRSLVENQHFNGHPDLVVKGRYPDNGVKAGEHGVEIKTTRKAGGAVDFHGARNQILCVFVYKADDTTEPANDRRPTEFTEVYIGKVALADFRKNARGELGTRTATLNRDGLSLFRANWVYRLNRE